MPLIRQIYRASPAFPRRLAWRFLNRLGAFPQSVKVGPAKGLKIVAPFSRRMNFCYGTHEPHVMQAIEQYVPNSGAAIDVGAFLGAHTLSMAAKVGSSGKVVAFEPYTESADLLEKTLQINHLSWVNCYRLALGDQNQQVRLIGSKSSMMRTSDMDADLHKKDSNLVEMTRLDDRTEITDLFTRLDLVKLDVEGGELAALHGMEALISRYHPVIICELTVHPYVPYQPHELVSWLHGHGYSLSILSDQSQPVSEFIEALIRKQANDENLGNWYVTHLVACCG